MPVYLLLGIGGLPSEPECMYIVPLMETIDIFTLIQHPVSTPNEILQRITKTEPKHKSSYMKQLRDKYPNAYKPWSEEDDKRLTELYNSGKTVKELSDTFLRNKGSITSKLRKLGLVER